MSIFVGPTDLKLYSVVDLKYCLHVQQTSNITEILVEFFLSKPLLGNFLTQFLPTALFLIIRKTNETSRNYNCDKVEINHLGERREGEGRGVGEGRGGE